MKLGLAASTMTIASLLAFAVPAAASPDPEPTTTVEAPVETDPAPEPEPEAPVETDPEPEAPVETDPEPNLGWLTGAASVGPQEGEDAIFTPAPGRAENQVQVIPTTSTTTTAPPPPTLAFGLPLNSGTGRRAVYSKSAQQVWAVDSNGTVIKTHRVSGRRLWCDPKPGTYAVFSRSRYTFALSNPDIIWGYMVRFTKGCNGGNIGFHEIPTNKTTGYKVQSISQLGTPLSGGCVRQALPDAQWMWDWASVGTKVVVLP